MSRFFILLILVPVLIFGSSCHTACHQAQRRNSKLIVGKDNFGKNDTKKYKRMNRRDL